MTDRWTNGWTDGRTDGKIMLLSHTLTTRGSHVAASLAKLSPVVQEETS